MVQVVTNGALLHKRGGAVKALPRGNGLVEGYLISFGSPQDSDLEGQWFTPNTELREKFFKDYPVLFHHGMDNTVGLDPIGRITALNKDSVGWYVQAFLDTNDRYGRTVYGLLQSEPFGWSSGAVDHLVVVLPSGEIVVWPLYEGSVTPSPMQPHKTTVRALKSLGIAPHLKESAAPLYRGWRVEADASERAAAAAAVKAMEGTIMLKARPSTLKTVYRVLKSSGFAPTKAQLRAIAADIDEQDAAAMAADEFDDSVMADDFEDDATMGFGGADEFANEDIGDKGFEDDDAMLADFEGDDAMMADDFEDDAMMGLDEPDGDEDFTMAFGDDEDVPTLSAMRKARRKGNEGEELDLTKPARTNKSRQKAWSSTQSNQAGYVNFLERRLKALELAKAPGEGMVGMRGTLKGARITDVADRPGAYKSAFTKYLTARDPYMAMSETERYVLNKGQRHEPPADSVKGYVDSRVKALNTSNAGSVGFAVPDDFVDELNRNVMVTAKTAAECGVRTTNSDTILIPDLPTSDPRRAYTGRVTWTGETASGQSEHDVTPIALGQINLPIHVMLVSTVSSLSAMEDAAFDLQSYITEAFAEMIAIEYEELIPSGNGQGKLLGILQDTRITGSASTGISSSGGYVASGAAAAVTDADKIIDMYMHLPPQYKATAKWYMNSNTARTLMKLKDGIGNYLWGDEHYGLNTGMPKTLMELPIVLNEWMPDIAANAYPVIVGDMAKGYLIGKRVEFSVRRFDDSVYASQDQCLILGRARLGGQPIKPYAFKLLKVATS